MTTDIRPAFSHGRVWPLPGNPGTGLAMAELAARLNCAEYKNWLKAGHSLLLLKAALQRFAGEQIHAFHRQLIAGDSARLSPSGFRCGGRCIPRGKQVRLPIPDPAQEPGTPRCVASAESIASQFALNLPGLDSLLGNPRRAFSDPFPKNTCIFPLLPGAWKRIRILSGNLQEKIEEP